MKKTLAIIGLLAVVVVFGFALISGKPNETPKQHPETTPPSQRAQEIDPKSVGGPNDPR